MAKKSGANNIFVLVGLAIALSIAAFLSPIASQDPDGLDRVAEDLKFNDKAIEQPITKDLPTAQIFDEYSLKAVSDEKLSTGIAGVMGTLLAFGLTWGLGKLVIRKPSK
jgi:cobalt/nickel transport protein